MITLYSTNCPQCHVLERKLDEAGLSYEINTNIDLMQEKGFQSAPMLEVDDNIMNFSQAIGWLRDNAD